MFGVTFCSGLHGILVDETLCYRDWRRDNTVGLKCESQRHLSRFGCLRTDYKKNVFYWSRDSSVGIATGYGLDDQGEAGVRVLVG
jgi:hypothetical protein